MGSVRQPVRRHRKRSRERLKRIPTSASLAVPITGNHEAKQCGKVGRNAAAWPEAQIKVSGCGCSSETWPTICGARLRHEENRDQAFRLFLSCSPSTSAGPSPWFNGSKFVPRHRPPDSGTLLVIRDWDKSYQYLRGPSTPRRLGLSAFSWRGLAEKSLAGDGRAAPQKAPTAQRIAYALLEVATSSSKKYLSIEN